MENINEAGNVIAWWNLEEFGENANLEDDENGIDEAGNAIIWGNLEEFDDNANLEDDENGIDEALPDELLAGYYCIILYAFYPPIKESTELQMLIGISYKIGLCVALILTYPIYRVIPRYLKLIGVNHWRGWVIELTHWNGLKYELYALCVYAAFSLSKFLRMPFVNLVVSLYLLYVPVQIANADMENVEDRINKVLRIIGFAYIRLGVCFVAFYWLYPAINDTAVALQLMIGISYEIGLCVALILAYPIYRIFLRPNSLFRQWRGWLIELTHWNYWEYELYVLRVYAVCSLSMFYRMPLVTLALSLVFARLPLRCVHCAVLVGSFSYFWWSNVFTSGSLYELFKLTWTVFSIRLFTLVFRLLD